MAKDTKRPEENSFDSIIQNLVEKALLNVSEPLLEGVVERVISRKLSNQNEEPIDIDQAAIFLKRAKRTIYGYCSKGTIPFHSKGDGGRNIFFKSELIEWLKNN